MEVLIDKTVCQRILQSATRIIVVRVRIGEFSLSASSSFQSERKVTYTGIDI